MQEVAQLAQRQVVGAAQSAAHHAPLARAHFAAERTAAPRPRTDGVADGDTRKRAAQRHVIGVDVRRAVRQLRARKEVARDALRDDAAHRSARDAKRAG